MKIRGEIAMPQNSMHHCLIRCTSFGNGRRHGLGRSPQAGLYCAMVEGSVISCWTGYNED
jgi:hypothetical protein